MILILNIHWGYFLINKVCQWFYQLGHVTFCKTVFWLVNFTQPFCQICYIQKSTLKVDISTKTLHKLQEVPVKVMWPHSRHSLIHIIEKFLDMILILNIHWGYFLINKVCQWFYQLGHVTFCKTVFWLVNFALPFCQICYIQNSTLKVDISTKMLRKL